MPIPGPKTTIIGMPARLLMFVGLCIAATLLSGCASMRLAYNHAPELVYWRLDSYADFTADQKSKVKQGITQWMRWHRTTQLPDYVALLASHRSMLQRDVTGAEVCALLDRGRERVVRGWAQVLPVASEVALTLKPSQLQRIEERLEKANREVREERLLDDPVEQREASEKRVREQAERLYGRLGPAQRAVVHAAVAASPDRPQEWYAERLQRQQRVLQTTRQLIEAHASKEQALAAYKQLVSEYMNPTDPALAKREAAERQQDCAMWANLHNASTPQQRHHASERLERWLTDFQLLVDEQ